MSKVKQKVSHLKVEIATSIGFTLLMIALSWSGIIYIPVSDNKLLDLSLVPAVFAAMIGGYKIAIPVAFIWGFISMGAFGETYEWYWVFLVKMAFVLSLVYFYALAKKRFPGSPDNVYRTIIAAVTIKNIIGCLIAMFVLTDLTLGSILKDNLVAYLIELAICSLSMKLIIDKLREFHILNGIKKKEENARKTESVTPPRSFTPVNRILVLQETNKKGDDMHVS